MRRIALAGVLSLVTSTALAGNHEVRIGPTNRALRSESANAVTADSLTGGSVGYAYQLHIPVLPGLQLWAEGAFGWGGAEGTMFQTLSTELDSVAFTAGGRARYALHARVAANARLDLGLARSAIALRDSSGHTAQDGGWGATSAAAVGLDLLAIHRPRFTLGLRIELGYTVTSGIPLTATPDSSSEGTLQLQMVAAGLGELDLSGRMFSTAVMSQF